MVLPLLAGSVNATPGCADEAGAVQQLNEPVERQDVAETVGLEDAAERLTEL